MFVVVNIQWSWFFLQIFKEFLKYLSLLMFLTGFFMTFKPMSGTHIYNLCYGYIMYSWMYNYMDFVLKIKLFVIVLFVQ